MSNEQQNSSIGAWKKQTPRGEVINFTINGQRYNMWPNGKKSKDNHPDFNIVEDNYVPQQKVVVQPQAQPQQQYVAQPQYVQPQYQQPQPQQPQPQQGFVPANNGLNF